jgi:hypothetical protein
MSSRRLIGLGGDLGKPPHRSAHHRALKLLEALDLLVETEGTTEPPRIPSAGRSAARSQPLDALALIEAPSEPKACRARFDFAE